jgi:hypothetical protein
VRGILFSIAAEGRKCRCKAMTTANLPNFTLTCPPCKLPIVVVWKKATPPPSDFVFTNVRCQECNWSGDRLASSGHLYQG